MRPRETFSDELPDPPDPRIGKALVAAACLTVAAVLAVWGVVKFL